VPAQVTGAEALPAEHAIVCANGVVRSPDALTSHVHALCIPFPSSAFTIGRRYAKRVAQAERHDDRSDPPIGRHTVESTAFCPEAHRGGILARSPPQHRLEPAAISRHEGCCRSCPARLLALPLGYAARVWETRQGATRGLRFGWDDVCGMDRSPHLVVTGSRGPRPPRRSAASRRRGAHRARP